jgi:hypothetical protein
MRTWSVRTPRGAQSAESRFYFRWRSRGQLSTDSTEHEGMYLVLRGMLLTSLWYPRSHFSEGQLMPRKVRDFQFVSIVFRLLIPAKSASVRRLWPVPRKFQFQVCMYVLCSLDRDIPFWICISLTRSYVAQNTHPKLKLHSDSSSSPLRPPQRWHTHNLARSSLAWLCGAV